MNASYADIASWYSHIRQMGEEAGAQFNSCQYGNFFEFGWNVEQIWPDSKVNCSAAAAIENASVQLLCHTRQLLRDKYQTALLHSPESAFNNESGQLVCGGLDGSCGMDPHPSWPSGMLNTEGSVDEMHGSSNRIHGFTYTKIRVFLHFSISFSNH